MILVTGGLGFIGSHTCRALLDMGERCVAAGRSAREVPGFLTPGSSTTGDRLVTERLDCTDLESVLEVGKRHEITGIVHLAAAAMGGRSPLDELQANTQALFTILRAAREWGVTRMVVASTIGVYGGVTPAGGVYREDMPLPIGSAHTIPAHKKSAEIVANAVSAQAGMQVVSARIGAVWGPLARPVSPFFGTPQLVHSAVNGTAIPGPLYAEDATDMCYAADCGRALALLQTAPTLSHLTYNVGGGRSVGNREVAEAIGRAVPGTDVRGVLREGRGPYAPEADAHLDITRLRADTGFEPVYGLDRGIAGYVAWLTAGNPR
ncbi:NAD-dependent epimerase [Planotetraspora thailandica]|uniref:NAD-dependent epimerase n=1 Tax=Planotetraspora thailandica TaxID=487172 RepID=A0A8J3Y047_9ACTN|nr:NAD(P)-dependent oxidoreductase [Planotetraspora thailandica]GII58353.1 NAD-dependent epimerase [Planotetraspora thailandica]